MSTFFNAVAPKPFRVLGKQLLPFSIGHQVLLEQNESAYAIGGKGSHESLEDFNKDLVFTVFVCCRRFEETIKALQSRWTLISNWIWGKRCGQFDITEAARVLVEYIDYHTALPKAWKCENVQAEKTGFHWLQLVKDHNQEKLKLSELQVMNLSYSLAQHNYYLHQERQGIIKVWTEEEFEAERVAKENAANIERLKAILGPGLIAAEKARRGE